ncbi:MAG: hypothetical protein J6B12_00505, partial [Clostridia bacterium]|nr:hypothetical protein [Clostridia bacterium]
VVHMLSHTDWERHDKVMADIFKASEDAGLEVWVDNWGIGGAPGDKSHFLAYHPEAHTVIGNGELHPYQICLNSPSYRQFVKDWIDEVASIGGKTVFWDEPHIPNVKTPDGKGYFSACTCPACQKMFEERFGKKMPAIMDGDVSAFNNATLVEFHDFVASYAKAAGMKNVICIMPYQLAGIGKQTSDPLERLRAMDVSEICAAENIDNIGTDPYWFGSKDITSPYEYVYNSTKTCVEVADRFGKDHNIWIQAYNAPRGREEEIIEATEAAYDAGARTILAWGFHGCEANNYRSKNPERSWAMTVEGMRRIKSTERDRILAENRKKYMK